jgi:hypothetical protein
LQSSVVITLDNRKLWKTIGITEESPLGLELSGVQEMHEYLELLISGTRASIANLFSSD